MVILEIDIDDGGKVTVRGKRGHVWNANGKTPLRWKGNPGIDTWTVTFEKGKSPFHGGRWQFGAKGAGSDGGMLKSHTGPDEERFHYDVTCKRNGEDYESDPEVVLWPD